MATVPDVMMNLLVKAEPVYQEVLQPKIVWSTVQSMLEKYKNPWLDLGSLEPAAIQFMLKRL